MAAKENKIHEWVLSFLRSSGDNHGLADTLEKSGQYHFGPVAYPVVEIVNILGSDQSYKYIEDEKILKEKVGDMAKSIQKGWQPPPLIATNLWEDYLELADGGHRQRALLELGRVEYQTIFYFRDKRTMDDFLSRISNT